IVAMLWRLVGVPVFVSLVFVALLGVAEWVYSRVPRGFVPDEDQGYLFILVQTPQGASLSYTMGVVRQAEDMLRKTPEIQNIFGIGGFGFAGTAPNSGMMFVSLKEYAQRPGDGHSAKAVVGRLFGAFSQITGGMVI